MTQQHPVVERYMMHFDEALKQFDFPGHDDVANEIRNHIAEAGASGKPLDAVLHSLGPADALARAYAVELLLNRSRSRRLEKLTAFLEVSSLVAVTSIATLVVVGILGTMGIGFTASGVAIVTIGGLEQAGIHLPGVQMNGIPSAWAIALGLFVFVIGGISLIGLRMYVRFIMRRAKTFRRGARAIPSLA